MTVEDFILLCRLKGWNDTASFIEQIYNDFRKAMSDDMRRHLKNRARNI